MHENNMTNDSKERERWRKIVLSKYEDGGEVS
jgi:hypothetical protein